MREHKQGACLDTTGMGETELRELVLSMSVKCAIATRAFEIAYHEHNKRVRADLDAVEQRQKDGGKPVFTTLLDTLEQVTGHLRSSKEVDKLEHEARELLHDLQHLAEGYAIATGALERPPAPEPTTQGEPKAEDPVAVD